MFKISTKILSTLILVCGLIGIQAQLTNDNEVFARSLEHCCNDGSCNNQSCSALSSLSDCASNEIAPDNFTCKECLDLEAQDMVSCPQAYNDFCNSNTGVKYFGNGCYEQTALDAVLSGPSDVESPFSKYAVNTYTWSVSASGGHSPYTYVWYKIQDGVETQVGTGTTYTETYHWTSAVGSTTFTLRVQITDTPIPGLVERRPQGCHPGFQISRSLNVTYCYNV